MKHISLVTNRTLTFCLTGLVFLLACFTTTAQVKIGDNPNTIKTASLLELESTNKGLVMPRVSLSSTINNPAPLAADILPGTIVYNTNAAFVGGTGLQIWTGTTWMVVTPSSLSSSDAWKLTGNSGTNPLTNFIGTTDAQPLIFKVNNQKAGTLDYTAANAAFGYQSLNVNTSGINNAAIGTFVLSSNTTGANNSAIGFVSLERNTTGSSNVASGNGAVRFNTTGSYNTGVGSQALNSNTTGTYNTAIGAEADVASGNLTNATAIGYNAQVNISNALILGDSINNVKIGIGTGSPTANLHVKGSVRFAGLTNGVLTADAAGNLNTTTLAAINGNNWGLTGNAGTNPANNFIGTTDAQPLVFKVNGQKAGFISNSTSATSTSFGYQALNVNTGNDNTATGYFSMIGNTTGTGNTSSGVSSLRTNTTGSSNTGTGWNSLFKNLTGNNNTANGVNSLFSNTADNNTATGFSSLSNNTTGVNNTANGMSALSTNTTGSNNTAMGIGALQSNTTGTNNTAIGNSADVGSNNLTNATAIGYNAKANISNSIILGNATDNVKVGIGTSSPGNPLTVKAFTDGSILGFYNNSGADKYNFSLTNGGLNLSESNVAAGRIFIKDGGNVGVGTISPTANLHINGTVRFENLTNGVLTADAIGNLSTTSLSSITGNSWSLTGNGGTNPSTNFIGTTDAQPLVFKLNGEKAGCLDYANTTANTTFGYQSLNSVTTGKYNVAIGYLTLKYNTTGNNNTANGYVALRDNTTGVNNTATGTGALVLNNIGNNNTANGSNSLTLNTSGNSNTASGSQALFYNQTGNNNTANGLKSLQLNTTGSFNVGCGDSSLRTNTIGNYNTAIGHNADVATNNLTNATAIGYNANVAISNAMVLGNGANVGIGTSSPANKLDVIGVGSFTAAGGGLRMQGIGSGSHTYVEFYPDGTGSSRSAWIGYGGNGTQNFSITNQIATGDMTLYTGRDLYLSPGSASFVLKGSTGYVGIGNSAPTAKLDVNGTVRFETLTNGILTTDASGNLSTTTIAAITGNSWGLTGNSSTNPANNFIGTSDAQPLVFKVNGQKAGRLDYLGSSANTSFGYGSLNAVTSGSGNVAVGYLTLPSNTTGNYNTANGFQALTTNTTGSNNTANGFQALRNTTIGSDNVAIGTNALANNTTGSNNVANGSAALYKNTTGNNNTANGWQALFSNTTGSNSNANGVGALYSNTTGSYNNADGYAALYSNTTGSYNTANGYAALNSNTTGSYNTANGNQALVANTIGNYNTANGALALVSNTIGNNNTANGHQALRNTTSGSDNAANGFDALLSNTTGADNVASGSLSLANNTTGNNNIANGFKALYSNTTANYNTAIGSNSLISNTGDGNTGTGYQSLYKNTVGTNNTAVGVNALYNNQWGNYNTAIGYGADVSGVLLNITNATAIGANAKVDVSNALVLGNGANIGIGTSSPGSKARVEIEGGVNRFLNNYQYMIPAGTGYSGPGGNATYSLYTSNRIWCGEEIDVTSDMRTKTNIVTSGSSKNLSLINKLRVVNYNYKDRIAKGTGNITGFLAQEVEQVMPDAITKNKGVVPDIYQNATTVKYDEAAKTLRLTLKETAAVKAGDSIKLITDAGEQLANIASVNGTDITINNWSQNSKWVFVYGKQVNDLRNLDYNKIFSAGIGAIQELSKQNEALKSDVETLKAQMKMLMEKMNATVQAN